ncbi:MAG TPA: FemAB family XrtA/PEP-CTERM system-associated protein [Candidatus Angelobacter sp.]|nr:FemAB family XrtA/PEP-CTERM system-associated protein [Candidatus Angelobacter sp.]
MNIVEYKDENRAAWDSYVMHHERGTLFHLIAWKHSIEREFQYKPRYLMATQGSQVVGVLPLFLVANMVTGRKLISTPFAVYGGICASDEQAEQALIKAACDLAQNERVEYLELRLQEGSYPGFHTKDLYVTLDTAIAPDTATLNKMLPRDTRYMIRKAQKAGLRTTNGHNELHAFYEIYARSVRNLGTPVFSRNFFRILLEELRESAEIMVVWKEQSAVAAVMSFRFRDWILPYYGGSTAEGRHLAANNFMYWELLESARQRGIRNFDFGRSKRGTGAYDFKSQWGMRERPLPYQFYLVKRKDLPDFSPANPRFNRAIELWKRIPFPVTKALGPALVKLFP